MAELRKKHTRFSLAFGSDPTIYYGIAILILPFVVQQRIYYHIMVTFLWKLFKKFIKSSLKELHMNQQPPMMLLRPRWFATSSMIALTQACDARYWLTLLLWHTIGQHATKLSSACCWWWGVGSGKWLLLPSYSFTGSMRLPLLTYIGFYLALVNNVK